MQTTLAKVYVAWGRLQRTSSADSYARRVLLNTFLSHRRLKRSSEGDHARGCQEHERQGLAQLRELLGTDQDVLRS